MNLSYMIRRSNKEFGPFHTMEDAIEQMNPGDEIVTYTEYGNVVDYGPQFDEEIYTGRPISEVVSPDAPTITNEKGGSQSDVNVRFDLIDAKALFRMAGVLDHGAKKYGANNWRHIPVEDHLNHLLMHVYAYLAGDETDDHLSHALCRATFALGVRLDPNWRDNG